MEIRQTLGSSRAQMCYTNLKSQQLRLAAGRKILYMPRFMPRLGIRVRLCCEQQGQRKRGGGAAGAAAPPKI